MIQLTPDTGHADAYEEAEGCLPPPAARGSWKPSLFDHNTYIPSPRIYSTHYTQLQRTAISLLCLSSEPLVYVT
jgi:hypothetical protein